MQQTDKGSWVRGIMLLDVGNKFRDRGSIPSEFQILRAVST